MKRVLVIIPIIIVIIAVIVLASGIFTLDGGKECTDSSQCQGLCMVKIKPESDNEIIGSCSIIPDPVGCFDMIYNGTIMEICVD